MENQQEDAGKKSAVEEFEELVKTLRPQQLPMLENLPKVDLSLPKEENAIIRLKALRNKLGLNGYVIENPEITVVEKPVIGEVIEEPKTQTIPAEVQVLIPTEKIPAKTIPAPVEGFPNRHIFAKEPIDLPADWPQRILDLYNNGACDVEVKRWIYNNRPKKKFSDELWKAWQTRHEEFFEVIKMGRILSEAWWRSMGRTNLAGDGIKKNFNEALWYMNMKNRFGWKDRSYGEFAGTIAAKPPNLKALSDEELDAYEKLLEKMNDAGNRPPDTNPTES